MNRPLRWWRRYRLDGNPLRRRWDRLETAALLAMAALVLLAAWPAAALGGAAYASGVRAEREERAGRVRTAATLIEDAPAFTPGTPDGLPAQITARARWYTPDGRAVIGSVTVPPRATAGSEVSLWLDREGKRTAPPRTRAETEFKAAATGAVCWMAAATGLVAALCLFRRRLDRRRYADWDAAWIRACDRWRRPRPI
ncbi:hypothetical protein HNP84_004012 [Thermocatellispora tengchongensis]|uniref:Uncharacterized protein n=1 Tax=Thermocatellispora tengchongensis TaxID=1073253 RepID=A0A840PA36_9ACTN|nr:hypothetical protein [Thermocatellispora tengchongensis]MBB5134280.1 hypothetical protein [Thermocatellispora tengchongensis]